MKDLVLTYSRLDVICTKMCKSCNTSDKMCNTSDKMCNSSINIVYTDIDKYTYIFDKNKKGNMCNMCDRCNKCSICNTSKIHVKYIISIRDKLDTSHKLQMSQAVKCNCYCSTC